MHVKTEPLSLEALFRQMSPEAVRFVHELDQRQREAFEGDSPLKKPFRIREGSWLSEILQQYAEQLGQEVLMELAPEQEWVHGVSTSTQTTLLALLSEQRLFVQGEGSVWLSPPIDQVDSDWEPAIAAVVLSWNAHYLPDLPESASVNTLWQVAATRLRNIWRFEVHDGVLIARNLLGFLSRVYDYPFDALVELERQAVVGSDGIPRIPPEARWRFVHALSRAPSNAIPAIAGYRMTRYLEADTELWTLLALLDRMPNKQHYWKRLQRGEGVEIPFTLLGADAGDRLLNLWRMNTFYYGGLQPFGYRHAWHPDFMLYLRRGRVSLFPSEYHISVSILGYVWDLENSEWDARTFHIGQFSWAWLGEPPQTTPSSR